MRELIMRDFGCLWNYEFSLDIWQIMLVLSTVTAIFGLIFVPIYLNVWKRFFLMLENMRKEVENEAKQLEVEFKKAVKEKNKLKIMQISEKISCLKKGNFLAEYPKSSLYPE